MVWDPVTGWLVEAMQHHPKNNTYSVGTKVSAAGIGA
eukprot:gene10089-57325_t